MAADSDQNREDVLKRANAYLSEVPDIESEPALKRYLKEAGVDIAKVQEQARSLVTRTIANRRLELARIRRSKKLTILERIKGRVAQLGASAAEQLEQLVQSQDLEGAQMLARKFEESHPEDVASLEEDLALLKEIEKDSDPNAGK